MNPTSIGSSSKVAATRLSAAKSVLETGEADYAWNLQIEPDELKRLEALGNGTVVTAFSSLVERVVLNQTNPDPALGDDRSEYLDGSNTASLPVEWRDTQSDVASDRPRSPD